MVWTFEPGQLPHQHQYFLLFYIFKLCQLLKYAIKSFHGFLNMALFHFHFHPDQPNTATQTAAELFLSIQQQKSGLGNSGASLRILSTNLATFSSLLQIVFIFFLPCDTAQQHLITFQIGYGLLFIEGIWQHLLGNLSENNQNFSFKNSSLELLT